MRSPTLIDFLAGRTRLIHIDDAQDISSLRVEYAKLNKENMRLEVSLDEKHEEVERLQRRLKESGDGRREAEENLVRARDRQYIAEDKVARIREIVSGRDLKIKAHQSNREEQTDGTATMEADQGTGAPAHAHRGSSG